VYQSTNIHFRNNLLPMESQNKAKININTCFMFIHTYKLHIQKICSSRYQSKERKIFFLDCVKRP